MNRTGQSIMETALLILVIAAALFAMQVYLKRGMQGRLRSASSSIGEQYDPEATNSTFSINHISNTITTSETMAPVVLEKYDCPEGYLPPSIYCVYWNETVSPTQTTTETVYDIVNKVGSEVVGAL